MKKAISEITFWKIQDKPIMPGLLNLQQCYIPVTPLFHVSCYDFGTGL